MKNKVKDKIVTFIIVVAFLGSLVGTIRGYMRHSMSVYYLRNHGAYTVGIAVEKKYGSLGKGDLVYKFQIKEKVYIGLVMLVGGVKVGDKFLVVYYPPNPDRSVLLYQKPINKFQLGQDLGHIYNKDNTEIGYWQVY